MTHDPTSPLEGAADGDASTIGTAVIDADAADAADPTATTASAASTGAVSAANATDVGDAAAARGPAARTGHPIN